MWPAVLSSVNVGSVSPRLHRVAVVMAVAAGTAAVTLMIGLVTNAASEQEQWPGLLARVQQYPWQSLTGLAVVAVGLASALAVLSTPSGTSAAGEMNPSGTQPTATTLAPVLRTLPPDLPVFSNRQREIDEIVRRVDSTSGGGTLIHTVNGMPGVGKTAFAVHVGHMLAPRFPDGQVFLDLNGYTTGQAPVAPTEALASLLLADGVPPQRIPVGDDEWVVREARTAMWRSRVAERRILVILDNAATYDQVEHLIPGAAGCLVVVTSRRRLIAPEMVALQMEEFAPRDAVALFASLCGRRDVDTTSLDELMRVCGNLPLAIALLATRLRQHPSWSIDDLNRRLLSASDRLTEMRLGGRALAAAFDLSYHDLPPERQLFFLRLSLSAGHSVDEYAAAALGEMPPEVARRHLEALYEDHLLDESERGRYRFHDLVRDYARSMSRSGLPSDDLVVERLACYYVRAVGAANRFIDRVPQPESATISDLGTLPALDSRAGALAWMDAEHVNVLSCVEECRRRERNELVVSLASVMAPYLRHAGPWDRAAQVHKAAVSAAQRIGNRAAEADALANLGLVSRLTADYSSAIQVLKDALDAYREVGSRHGQAQTLNQLGIVWYLMAEYPQAATAQTESLTICRETGDLLGQANALADLGMVRRMTGHLSASARAQTEALALYRRIGDRFGQANSLRALGAVSCLTGDYAAAEREATAAQAIYREIGDRVHQAYALNELGVARRLRGDLAGGMLAHQGALEQHQDLGDRFGEAEAIRHLGVLHRLAGDLDAAQRAQIQAAAIYADLGNRGGEAASTTELGALNRLNGDHAAAQGAFEKALAVFLELDDRCGQTEVHNHYGELHLAGGEPSLAREQFELALRLSQATDLPLQEADAWQGLAQCDVSIGSPADAIDHLTRALSIYERLGAEARRSVESQLHALIDGDHDPLDTG